jgi:hypothetical protein
MDAAHRSQKRENCQQPAVFYLEGTKESGAIRRQTRVTCVASARRRSQQQSQLVRPQSRNQSDLDVLAIACPPVLSWPAYLIRNRLFSSANLRCLTMTSRSLIFGTKTGPRYERLGYTSEKLAGDTLPGLSSIPLNIHSTDIQCRTRMGIDRLPSKATRHHQACGDSSQLWAQGSQSAQ